MNDFADDKPLRCGWTTGACATAATRAACLALFGDPVPEPVTIRLPRGETPGFHLSLFEQGQGWARAGVVKDAGDDPDVTHGATIIATVRRGRPGSGVTFHAGPGVGTVTRPGLPLPPGEPAINPVPRRLMSAEVVDIARRLGQPTDIEIEISVPGGETLAQATWNPRLGIVGGISILGTTGIVVPYSCSAWIHSIQRGIDVARATGQSHVVASIGNSSEKAALALTGLPPDAVIDMGDFVGGMLKYLRRHPVARVTIAGGFAKISKLAAGAMDLHSKRSQVNMAWLAGQVQALGATKDVIAAAAHANTALAVLELSQAAGVPLGDVIASQAAQTARGVLAGAEVRLDVLVFNRKGELVGASHQ